MKIRHLIPIVAGMLFMPFAANAGSISPSSFEATIAVGETVTIEKTVTTDPGLALSKVDVYFLADNTGSMGGIINSVKSNATTILNAISGGDARFSGIDVNFGVGRYLGDPVEPFYNATNAYTVQQTMTSSVVDTQTAINGWFASGGGDGPEANFYALHQAATNGANTPSGVGGGQSTGWRSDAGKVIVWFGDAQSHTATVNQADTIAALQAEGVTVAAINTRSAGNGIDRFGQASAITSATGGTLTNGVSGSAATIDAILNAVASATSTIDLTLATSGDTSGLDITFTCTDAAGCDDVTGGESRTFEMSVTGVTEGVYDFDVFAPGVRDAVEEDLITVVAGGGGPSVPAPGAALLMGLALLGMAVTRRKAA